MWGPMWMDVAALGGRAPGEVVAETAAA
jgi:hypothetical protein